MYNPPNIIPASPPPPKQDLSAALQDFIHNLMQTRAQQEMMKQRQEEMKLRQEEGKREAEMLKLRHEQEKRIAEAQHLQNQLDIRQRQFEEAGKPIQGAPPIDFGVTPGTQIPQPPLPPEITPTDMPRQAAPQVDIAGVFGAGGEQLIAPEKFQRMFQSQIDAAARRKFMEEQIGRGFAPVTPESAEAMPPEARAFYSLPGMMVPPETVRQFIKPAKAEEPVIRELGGRVAAIVPQTGKELWSKIITPAPKGAAEPRKLTDKRIDELSDMQSLIARTDDVAGLQSSYAYEISNWTPNVVKGFLAETVDNKFFSDAMKYDPAYFLYTAETLKAIQGSRPSDFDMKVYLQNMPRLADPPKVKEAKITRLRNQLVGRYNKKVEAYRKQGFNMAGFDMIGGEGESAAGQADPLGIR